LGAIVFGDQDSAQLLDLGYLTLGAVILATGLVALSLALLRRDRRDVAMGSFGCLCVLVGLRFLVDATAVRQVLGGSTDSWDTVRSILTYLLTVTAFATTVHYLGRGWRSSLRLATWGYTTFAGVALVSHLGFSAGRSLVLTNHLLNAVVLLTIFVNVVRPERRKSRAKRIVAVCSMAGVMYFVLEALRDLQILSLNFHNEWARTTIFHSTAVVLVLVIRTFFIKEERLAAVRQEMNTARKIQASILPRSAPRASGLNIASRYEPMTEVAGDFYDFAIIDPHCVGVLVADVSGHGVGAALIASMVKVAFLAQTDQARDPAAVLRGLNRTLGGQLEGQFVTAGYAVIDSKSGRLSYAGAGHPPLLIRPSGGGDIVCIEENGLMLGPFPDADYGTTSYSLTAGDRIVMYTDGITEAANRDQEQFGETRLQQMLAASGGTPATSFANQLLAEISAWEGRRRGDDLTLVVIDYLSQD